MSADAHHEALAAVERILARGGDADDILRRVVAAIHEQVPHFGRVGIAFMEEGRLVLGPHAGEGEGEALPRARHVRATLVPPYCFVGWDTQGVPWADVS